MQRFHFLLAAVVALGCAGEALASQGQSVDVLVAATTDVHGWLRGWDYYGNATDSARGLSRAATVVDSLRRAAPGRVILVDAGDLLQGTPLAYVASRVSADTISPVIAAMNAMAYDAAAVGNHEYNYGVPTLMRAVGQATFPFLSSNTYRTDGQRAFPAWRIVDRGGVRVGIVGATTPGVMVWDGDNVRGRVVLRDIIPDVRSAVTEVRGAGADIVIVTVHTGLSGRSSYDTVSSGVASENVAARIAKEVPGIVLVVYGHSHQQMADTTINGVLLVQPKNWATSVAVARLTVTRGATGWSVTAAHGQLIPVAGRAEQAGVVAATQRMHVETVRYVTTPIGNTPVAWRSDSARVADTPLIDFVLEVERAAAGADLASTAAFRLDASLKAGPVTVADLAKLYPYDNTLRALRITGRQLREYLEFSARYFRAAGATGPVVDQSIPGYNFDIVAGADYTIDLSRPIGSRITTLNVKGKPVTDADSFTLALNNYRAGGGGGYAMLAGAPVTYDRQIEIRQLMIDEVRRRGTIVPADYVHANWHLEPPTLAARAFAELSRDAAASARSAGEVLTAPAIPASARGASGAPDASPASGRAAQQPSPSRATPPTDNAVASRSQPRLRIIATNDFHGALEPRPDANGVVRGGAAAVAGAIRHAQEECAPGCVTLLLDGGDLFQGTPASNLAFGRPVVDLYNMMGYAATALGNHEFDWGTDTLRARMRDAHFRIMAANVRDSAGNDVAWIQDDTIVQRGAARIGIIGVATRSTPQTTRSINVAGLRFDDPAPIVDAHAKALRARGATYIVVVAHAGASCDGQSAGATSCRGEIVDLANRVTVHIDAIVSGHTHSLVDTEVNGIPIVQARSSGRAIAVLDLPLPANSRVEARAEVRDVVWDSVPHDARADSLARRAANAVAAIANRPIARFAADMRRAGGQYALGNFIADAQRWAGKADVAVMNNGGIRADIRGGEATYGTLFEIQPFANTLYGSTLSGASLRQYLERLVQGNPNVHISGVTIEYDPTRAAGSRILTARMANGSALDDRATYTIVINDFMATGGDNLALPASAPAAQPLNIVDLDALIDYARSLPQPIAAPAEMRLVAKRP
jgi:2',3'-cyclic-nucleotide 2'-phosphodiesterase (5'-nucleotidase family)